MGVNNQKQYMLVLLAIFFLVLSGFAQMEKTKIKVISKKSNLRFEPDINSAVISVKIPKGSILEVERKAGEWFEVRVRTPSGTQITGYIHEKYVEVVAKTIEEKVDSVREPSKKMKGLFGLCIKGGAGTVDSGDFNNLVQGYRDYWSRSEDYANWPKLGLMMEFSAEILFNFTQNIGFGIGAGYITQNNAGEYGSQYPSFQVDYDREYQFRVIPISGNLHIHFLKSSLFGFSIHGGIDYLLGSITHTYTFQSNAGSSSRREDVKNNTVGYHGGVSIDINFSSRVSLVLEGAYRFADFKDWKGSVDSPDIENFDGELYFYEYQSGYYEEYYPRMWVWSGAPSASYYRNVRLARINLSGFFAIAGIKIIF
jgi:hypothetical protein